ncbi:MAG: nucleotidyltransferase domain-containing protein, partial [Patescibacteria group bacterium]
VAEIQKKIVPILKRRAIRRAGLFGSAARGERTARDVDVLVEMPRPYGLFAFLALKHELEACLDTKVDLIEYSHIKPALRERILSGEVKIL